jgi:hypothetical protein
MPRLKSLRMQWSVRLPDGALRILGENCRHLTKYDMRSACSIEALRSHDTTVPVLPELKELIVDRFTESLAGSR